MNSLRWPVVLFDFDGTLADTIPLIVASYRHALTSVLGESAHDDEVRSWIGRPLQPVLEERYPGRGAELTDVYRAWNLDNHDELIQTVDGIPELLDDLHAAGARTGVVSSKKAATVESACARSASPPASTCWRAWRPRRCTSPTPPPSCMPRSGWASGLPTASTSGTRPWTSRRLGRPAWAPGRHLGRRHPTRPGGGRTARRGRRRGRPEGRLLGSPRL